MKKSVLYVLALTGLLTIPMLMGCEVMAAKTTDRTASVSKVKLDGWINDGELIYYYKDGEMVTGPVTIEGKKYFFDPDSGVQVRGLVEYKGKKYFYNENTGVQKKGFVSWQGNRYYFGKKGYALKGIQKIGKYRYYFDKNGVMARKTLVKGKYLAGPKGRFLTGFRTYEGNRYYFDSATYQAVTGWKYIDKTMYYFQADGTLQSLSGLQTTTDNEKYYYDPATGEMKKGWMTIDDQTYYFSKANGKAITGWKKINKKSYYFDENGVLIRNQFIEGERYTDENGQRVYGWREIEGKQYYFDTKTGKLPEEGWQSFDEGSYYILNDRSVAFSMWINERQYVDETGALVSGWKELGGNTYYFHLKKYKCYTGWKRIDNVVYYFNENGILQKLAGLNANKKQHYYFDPVTGQMLTGWVTETDKTYYLNPENGRAYKGWKTIDGYEYYFDKTTCELQKETWIDDYYVDAEGKRLYSTWIGAYYVGLDGKKTGETREPGLFKEGENTFCLDENFEKVTGWQNVNEVTYYFDPLTGVMVTNKWVEGYYLDANGVRTSAEWTTIEGVNYLFLENGRKATGLVEYNGEKYYFSTVTGAQQTGFKVIDDVTYYFDPEQNGAMAVSETVKINGIPYVFDEAGNMTADVMIDEAVGKKIADYAQQYIGYPYQAGGGSSLTGGVDCSGFVMLVMRDMGIKVPRDSKSQYNGVAGYKAPLYIAVEDLKPGDLIFYYASNDHVGIYIGDGKIVHASNSAPYPQGGIKISNYNYTYIYGCARYWYDETLDQGITE